MLMELLAKGAGVCSIGGSVMVAWAAAGGAAVTATCLTCERCWILASCTWRCCQDAMETAANATRPAHEWCLGFWWAKKGGGGLGLLPLGRFTFLFWTTHPWTCNGSLRCLFITLLTVHRSFAPACFLQQQMLLSSKCFSGICACLNGRLQGAAAAAPAARQDGLPLTAPRAVASTAL